ncbi:hypothetical protein BU25DRAFT_462211 [Macroventuria anomochaeta]|uniref:Uncharacterized protein n=1 Tax=Macroventuria anomochaeta TaxID=301207 RepID=A0ACB6RN17_9PLEO|nr:uncharacterized protein BU25DRAFT_462211 [Macroventuria anomochaeta]KAF2623321.1 hypothetical protein BU25DRAFT_462211 [Macroventuria anomochaeta]
MPGDVPDWIRRRSEASRGPPRPMQVLLHQEGHWNTPPSYEDDDEDLYELDAGPPSASGANGNAVPRTVPSGEWREDYGEQGAVQSDDDEELARALELSQQEEALSGGFDENQIKKALIDSLVLQ